MIYDESQAIEKAASLIESPESETVEFKEARGSFATDEIGRYFSALSNEANLRSLPCGWLLFGVTDSGAVCGTNFRNDGTGAPSKGLARLKHEIAENTNDRMCFSEIYEVELEGRRVILFQVPAARPGVPTSWKKAAYERVGDRLEPLSLPKLERIASQRGYDWSAQPAFGSGACDLDEAAVADARSRYLAHLGAHAGIAGQLDGAALLEKMGATRDGVPTNAGLLLLGRKEASRFFDGLIPRITWTLYLSNGQADTYEHLDMPLLSAADRLLALIRNTRFQMFPDPSSTDPVTQLHYDPGVLREVVYNCLAHQDYGLRGRVNVMEFEDRIVFLNEGDFIPGTLERALDAGYRPPRYRNPWLSDLMVSLGLIDTATLGIPRVFALQAARGLPLPDYDLSEPGRVRVTVHGSPMSVAYSRILFANPGLPLDVAVALDAVQKGAGLGAGDFARLSQLGFCSGSPESPVLVEPDGSEAPGSSPAAGAPAPPLGDMVLEALEGGGKTRSQIIRAIALGHGVDLGGGTGPKKVTRELARLESEGKVVRSGESRARVWTAR